MGTSTAQSRQRHVCSKMTCRQRVKQLRHSPHPFSLSLPKDNLTPHILTDHLAMKAGKYPDTFRNGLPSTVLSSRNSILVSSREHCKYKPSSWSLSNASQKNMSYEVNKTPSNIQIYSAKVAKSLFPFLCISVFRFLTLTNMLSLTGFQNHCDPNSYSLWKKKIV